MTWIAVLQSTGCYIVRRWKELADDGILQFSAAIAHVWSDRMAQSWKNLFWIRHLHNSHPFWFTWAAEIRKRDSANPRLNCCLQARSCFNSAVLDEQFPVKLCKISKQSPMWIVNWANTSNSDILQGTSNGVSLKLLVKRLVVMALDTEHFRSLLSRIPRFRRPPQLIWCRVISEVGTDSALVNISIFFYFTPL